MNTFAPKLPQKIDVDTIRKMRMNGQSVEAFELVQAYQKNLLENKEQLRKELVNRDRKVKGALGGCIHDGCLNTPNKGYATCEPHLIQNESIRKRGRKSEAGECESRTMAQKKAIQERKRNFCDEQPCVQDKLGKKTETTRRV